MKKRVKKHLALLTAAVVMVLTVMSWLPGSTYEVKAVTSEVQVNSIAGIKNAFDTCTGDSDFYVELQADIAISDGYLSDGPVFTLTAGKITVDLNGHSLDASASTSSGMIFSRYFREMLCRWATSFMGRQPSSACSARSIITRRA